MPAGGIDQLKYVELPKELPLFAVFLRQRKYNPEVVYKPMDTAAKQAMIAATRTSGEDFFLKMIMPLDWELLEENIDDHVGSNSRFDSCNYSGFEAHSIVRRRTNAADGDPIQRYLTNDEITVLYNNIVNTNRSPAKKGSVSKKAGAVGMAMSVFRDVNGDLVRGWQI